MELEKCIGKRRSIRKYRDEPVDRLMIEQVIQAAIYAPSWKNSQVSRYYVVDKPAQREKLLACLPEFNQKSVKDAPVFIVTTVVKDRSGYNRQGEPDTHLGSGFQYFDNGLQVMNLCLKAYDLGLGTLIMGIYDEKEIREYLEIPETENIVVVIALGYSDEENDMPRRKGVKDVLTYKE